MRLDPVTEDIARVREATRRCTISGLTTDVGAAASINEISNIAVFLQVRKDQPEKIGEVATGGTKRAKVELRRVFQG